MLKVVKRYTMPLKRTPATKSKIDQFRSSFIFSFRFLGDIIPGSNVIFSSYPGTLHSLGSISHSIIYLKFLAFFIS